MVGDANVLFDNVLDPLSTNALIDCCVASAVLLSVDMSSSSRTVVTLAPEVPSCNPDELNVPIVDPSTVTVIVPVPVSATVTFELFCTIDVEEILPTSLSTYALIDCCVASAVSLFEDMLSSSFIPVTVAPSPAMFNEVPATNAPVTSIASATVIFDESAALNVVPLTVRASSTMFPVPDVLNVKSAFVGATRLVIDTSPSAANSKAVPAPFTFKTCPADPIDDRPVPPNAGPMTSPVWNSANPVGTLS